MISLGEEKDKALEEAGCVINELRGKVETVTSENKRLLDVIKKMSSERKAVADKEVQTAEEVLTEENSGAEMVEEKSETAAPTIRARQQED